MLLRTCKRMLLILPCNVCIYAAVPGKDNWVELTARRGSYYEGVPFYRSTDMISVYLRVKGFILLRVYRYC